ncbi:helix-turn-helix transcriptional regulator [Sphingobacterium oryzagri]|uniref:Helix-turn-helix transcriptional regulator n=1 Tax=Sphingobacterium oryzagri TaxID=3025669 RepID=A0ABY7WNF0_9SPHI|nr:helix-turn-helix transcriptional regulator [Sphingobacterium sp. KACC 22765]WDF70718.1 helix-turn-helix transcriptional regulator [Sphingobacterium sp. KACC 22765]
MHQKIQEVPGLPINDYYVFDKVKNELVDTNNVFNLTKREQHIFDLIRDGLSSNEIADKLNLSRHTVDTHRKNILKRTNTKNFFALQMKFNSVNESMTSLAR